MNNKTLLIITGPTAVGKTEYALKIAHALRGEIINGDMGQLYTPLTIGTAKPAWRTESIPHHLFDIITVPQDYTVAMYRTQVKAVLAEVWSRGNLPIIVGGSLFYLQSLFFPPLETAVTTENTCSAEHAPVTPTWEKLHVLDPVRAQAVHPHDTYRIKRALELWSLTGKLPSTCAPSYAPLCRTHILFLTRDRTELYQRINERVIQMIDQGWLNEVAQLQATPWEAFLHRKKIIGYSELLTYLAEQPMPSALATVQATIQQKTRRYAKQQESFMRLLERRLINVLQSAPMTVTTQRLDLTSYQDDLYINHLADEIGLILQK